jgi:hypothetical protein
MTRKHYVMIAEALRHEMKYAENESERMGIKNTAFKLAFTFGQDNPRFDRERFLDVAIRDI